MSSSYFIFIEERRETFVTLRVSSRVLAISDDKIFEPLHGLLPVSDNYKKRSYIIICGDTLRQHKEVLFQEQALTSRCHIAAMIGECAFVGKLQSAAAEDGSDHCYICNKRIDSCWFTNNALGLILA